MLATLILAATTSANDDPVRISGYMQPQLVWAEEGAAFRIRRARPKLTFTPTSSVRFVFELDPFPTGGPAEGTGTIARDTTVAYKASLGKNVALELIAGIFKVPLSAELLESSGERPFVERSWASRNWFPSERDTGAWLRLQAFRSTLDVAVVNGVVQGEPSFAVVPSSDRYKDVVLRARHDFGPAQFGLGAYYGHDERVVNRPLERWAFRMEAALRLRWSRALPPTSLSTELTVASNLDRGVRYAVAAASEDPQLQRGFFVRVEQPIGWGAVLGVRFDHYSPNVALARNARDTVGVVLGVPIATGLRVLAEVARAVDGVRGPGEPEARRVISIGTLTLVARL